MEYFQRGSAEDVQRQRRSKDRFRLSPNEAGVLPATPRPDGRIPSDESTAHARHLLRLPPEQSRFEEGCFRVRSAGGGRRATATTTGGRGGGEEEE